MPDEPQPQKQFTWTSVEAYDWVPPELAHTIPTMRLTAACVDGDWAVMRELLTERPEAVNGFWTDVDEEFWLTPLISAAVNGSPEAVAWLLDHSAAPDEPDRQSGSTPLWDAAWQVRQVWVLRDSPRVRDAAEWDDWARRFHIIRLLLDAGADPHATCGDGSSPDKVMRDFSQVGLLEAIAEFERLRAAG